MAAGYLDIEWIYANAMKWIVVDSAAVAIATGNIILPGDGDVYVSVRTGPNTETVTELVNLLP